MKNFIAIICICTATISLSKDLPELNIYAPDYFTSEWGPGPSIETAFEEICDCDLKFSPGELLPRLMLEGSKTNADIVIGLNTDVINKALKTGLFAPHHQDNNELELPIEWKDKIFLPFNWSYISFIFDARTTNLPKNFEDLANIEDNIKIVIQDPRTSISGLALVLWVKAIYGDQSEDYWSRLAPKILTVTKGWSESYGLFTEGEAEGVLSFTTSPAYHIVVESENTKRAAIFNEGHYPYFELAAKMSGTKQPELADKFMSFILSDNFQNLIPMTNWSYPSAQPKSEWPEPFKDLPIPQKTLFFNSTQAQELRKEAVEEWRRALSQ